MSLITDDNGDDSIHPTWFDLGLMALVLVAIFGLALWVVRC